MAGKLEEEAAAAEVDFGLAVDQMRIVGERAYRRPWPRFNPIKENLKERNFTAEHNY